MLKSKMVPMNWTTRRVYHYTPGVFFERPKYWNCHKHNFAQDALSSHERFGFDLESEIRKAADRHRAHRKHRLPWHNIWRGSLCLVFPRRSRIDRIKFWYMGNPNHNRHKIVEVIRRGVCQRDECAGIVEYYSRTGHTHVCETHKDS